MNNGEFDMLDKLEILERIEIDRRDYEIWEKQLHDEVFDPRVSDLEYFKSRAKHHNIPLHSKP